MLTLLALLLSLLKQIHSQDALSMAMMDAADDARGAGVPPAEWERVQKIVLKRWSLERRRNPLSALF